MEAVTRFSPWRYVEKMPSSTPQLLASREIVQRMLDEGRRQEGVIERVYFLSAPDDLQHTINLDQPVKNDLPTAFVQGKRYVSLAALRKAQRTSELVEKADNHEGPCCNSS